MRFPSLHGFAQNESSNNAKVYVCSNIKLNVGQFIKENQQQQQTTVKCTIKLNK